MSTRSISWGKGGRCRRLTNLSPSCAVVTKSGKLNFLRNFWDCFTFTLSFVRPVEAECRLYLLPSAIFRNFPHTLYLRQGYSHFPEIQEPSQDSRRQNGAKEQVTNIVVTHIRRHSTNLVAWHLRITNICFSFWCVNKDPLVSHTTVDGFSSGTNFQLFVAEFCFSKGFRNCRRFHQIQFMDLDDFNSKCSFGNTEN
jgi:hypothetical protein